MKKLTTILLTTTLALAACGKGDFNGAGQQSTIKPSTTTQDAPSSKHEEVSVEGIKFSFWRIPLDRRSPHFHSDDSFNTFTAEITVPTSLLNRRVYVERTDLASNSSVTINSPSGIYFYEQYHLDQSILDIHKVRYVVRNETEVFKVFEVEAKPDLVIDKDTDLRAMIGDRDTIEVETFFLGNNSSSWIKATPTLYIGTLELTIKATNFVSDYGRIANFTDDQVANTQNMGDNLSGGYLVIDADYFAGPLAVEMQGRNGPPWGKGGDSGFVTLNAELVKADDSEVEFHEQPGSDFGAPPQPQGYLKSKANFRSFIKYN